MSSYNLFQDWRSNRGNIKGRIVLVLYRLATVGRLNRVCFIILLPYLVFYRICIEWILGIELPYKLKIGSNLKLYHGQSLVVNDGATIGSHCTLRHCITIGNKVNKVTSYTGCPKIGDNVDIGSNVCIIGEISIGNNVKIGAGSVIIKDVPDNAVVVGNPGRIVNIGQ